MEVVETLYKLGIIVSKQNEESKKLIQKNYKNIEIRRLRIEVVQTFDNLWTIVSKHNEESKKN